MREVSPGIISDPAILGGRPVIRGHRIAVSQLVGQIAGGMTLREVQEDYALTDNEMQAVLAYIERTMNEQDVAHAEHAEHA